jgi:hypothetical protein
MKNQNKKAEKVLEALNTLALRLTDHDHKWAQEDRRAYGLVSRWITSFCDEDLEA